MFARRSSASSTAASPLTLPDGPWRALVRETTHEELSERVGEISGVLRLLDAMDSSEQVPPRVKLADLIDAALEGQPVDLVRLRHLIEEHRDQADVMFDHISRLPTAQIAQLTGAHPGVMARVARDMGNHLLTGDWGRRDFNRMAGPVGFVFQTARTLGATGRYGLLEDVALVLFCADEHCNRFTTRDQIRRWLDAVSCETGQAVARAMRHAGERAVAWYLAEGWRPATSSRELMVALTMPQTPSGSSSD